MSTFVFLEGVVIAEQTDTIPGASAGAESINWIQKDPAETSSYAGGKQWALDPQGIATEAPNYAALSQYPDYYSQRYNSYNYGRSYDPWQGTGVNSPNSSGAGGGVPGSPMTCIFMGANIPCGTVPGGAIQCPNNDCGPRNVNGSLTPIVYGVGVGWGATQTRRQERRNKPTLKNRPKGTPRPVVKEEDLEKPITNANLPNRFGLYAYFESDGDLVKKLQVIIDYAIKGPTNKECTKAFEAAKAVPIKDQLASTTVVTEYMFNDARNDYQWTDGADIGDALREMFNGSAGTYDVSSRGLYNETGRRFIGLTNMALNPPKEIYREYLSVVVIHSLIHTGGRGGIPSDATWLQRRMSPNYSHHDLKYLGEEYKDILKYCTKEGKSNQLYGQ